MLGLLVVASETQAAGNDAEWVLELNETSLDRTKRKISEHILLWRMEYDVFILEFIVCVCVIYGQYMQVDHDYSWHWSIIETIICMLQISIASTLLLNI